MAAGNCRNSLRDRWIQVWLEFLFDDFVILDSVRVCMCANIFEAPPGTATGRDVKLQEEELPLGLDMC